MSDLKFACPQCTQHITCDSAWAGQIIQCPSCQQNITVPEAAPGLRLGSTPPPAPAAPVFTSIAAPQSAIPEKWSGSAIASLVLAFFGPIGWIISILLGHSAKEQIRSNPRLRGDVLATLGLTFSYAFCLMAVASVCAWFALRHYAQKRYAERQKEMIAQREQMTRAWMSGTGTLSAAQMRQMAYNQPQLPMPANAANGTVAGKPFRYEHAIASYGRFILRQGTNMTADRQITIATFVSPADLANKTLLVTPQMRSARLQVTAEWLDEAGYSQRNWKANGYSLRLKFGPIENRQMSGTIDLVLPGATPTSVKGDFLAAVQ